MRWTFLISFIFFFSFSFAQNCGLGQDPGSAFPVCGTSVFSQTTVPICGGNTIPGQCPSSDGLTDKNPYWYRFTCFSSGTLGFKITPLTLAEDYDWQVFDITNRSPGDVFTDPSLFVACNWSAEFGVTGASSAGNSLVRCAGPGVPLFSSMPNIISGHTYLLLVSHFSDSQSGYSLTFTGGSASITDPVPPHLLQATAACDGSIIALKYNKKMKCSSLTSSGSEFVITPTAATVVSATGINCTSGFDMDSVKIVLSNALPPGTYTLSIQNGSDGNTSLDNCDNGIPAGESVQITVAPIQPTPLDSIAPVECAPDNLKLVFKKNIRCNTIAADGSDFSITGPYPVSITGAQGTCNNDGTSKIITLQLSQPLQTAGNFTITLKVGTDGNTLNDECGQTTPPGSNVSFFVKDTVNADFTYNIGYGCITDTINFFHNGANGVNTWTWNFDSTRESHLQNPQIYYAVFGTKNVQLIVSNGTCSDTSKAQIILDNILNPEFAFPEVVCPQDQAIFTDNSTGNIINWLWEFGNGNTSNNEVPPPQTYTESNGPVSVPVKLTVTNNFGCSAVKEHAILVANNCYIAVPNAFTPNGDGKNDYLYPLNAYKAKSLSFSIYNRFGQRIFTSDNWLNKWNGKYNGRDADPGTYVWVLNYFNPDTNAFVSQKGTTTLIR